MVTSPVAPWGVGGGGVPGANWSVLIKKSISTKYTCNSG